MIRGRTSEHHRLALAEQQVHKTPRTPFCNYSLVISEVRLFLEQRINSGWMHYLADAINYSYG